MKIFSKKEMLTDQALLDDEDNTGGGTTVSPASEEVKRSDDAVKNEDEDLDTTKSRSSIDTATALDGKTRRERLVKV
ncbi:unnamed protein product [Cylicostephanus goldi]|uniref:Uncharacterized protein n=1 Tax=Cylicostephanus goldi TaxID=71465 RepID=A0A3P6RWG1_CYLGO|nr:unnamed protein product [Cylicostephanus goldi]